MNIRCPNCQTVFRVNPERIPPQGVRAKCARCGGTFHVAPSSAAPQAGATPPPPRAPQQPAPPPPPPPRAPEPSRPASAPAPATATADRPAFGARDPNVRAARLARALVSDIVAYHPERRDRSLEQGNLRAEFREEIMKSWEEYVAQVGEEVAKSTPFFREALNEILAKGQSMF